MRKSSALAERSFEGLRDVLFDELDKLRGGKSKPEHANSVARLAGEITRSAVAQLELARFAVMNGKKNVGIGLLK